MKISRRPYEYLQYERNYEETSRFIHEKKELINGEQVKNDSLYDEVSTIQADVFIACGIR